MTQRSYDLLIVGGGINGTGIARDAAGRGLSVLLVEQGDLAGGTSSASTKLIHGGLRYLEQYEFRLVREALGEREVLMAAAPHIIWPLRFVLPHDGHLRPRWMIRAGLFLYDHLGGRKVLPRSHGLDFRRDPAGLPLKPAYRFGFDYADCWVDDARLVVLCAQDAQARGAVIRTRTALISAQRQGAEWRATLGDGSTVHARAMVNAAGPAVRHLLVDALGQQPHNAVRLVKGSHIVVPRLFDGEHAYIFQQPDRRIVFAIPYQDAFTLIGTTDVPVADGEAPRASDEEVAYLCAATSRYFTRAIAPADVVWTYSGIRPLYDDGASAASEITRDYVLDLDVPDGQAPLLSIYGGKITTFRRLAEHALRDLARFFPAATGPWTQGATLPGGAMADFATWFVGLAERHASLPRDWLHALARRHGTVCAALLDGVRSPADLGRDFGGGLFEREVRWCIEREWARDPDDVLWRRTKTGLHMTPDQRAVFADWFRSQSTPVPE